MPAWLAWIVQVPAPTNETVEPLRVQMPALPAAIVNVTARPDDAVADTVYVAPPTVAPPGGVEVKLIVCVRRLTVNDCCTCGAAW